MCKFLCLSGIFLMVKSKFFFLLSCFGLVIEVMFFIVLMRIMDLMSDLCGEFRCLMR